MNTTSNLSELMQNFYDRMFLKRVSESVVLDQFGQRRPIPQGEGKVIYFSRYSNLAVATTALTEGENPAGSNLSAANVTATALEYGDWIKISSLVSMTALDRGISEKIPILSTQAAETIETLISNEVGANGTEQIVSTKTALSAITATDVLTSKDIRIAVRNLKNAKAMPLEGGFFAGVVSPYTEYDFQSDSTWVAAKQYSDVMDLYKGEIGRWFGVRFVCGTMPYRQDTNGTANRASGAVHSTLVMGAEGYGITEIEGGGKKIIVKSSNDGDTSNPLNRFSTAGWVMTFVPKILNSTFVRVIKTGVTA